MNRKCQAINYADLGGAVVCKFCLKSSIDSDNGAEQEFGAWSIWDLNGGQYQYEQGKKVGNM